MIEVILLNDRALLTLDTTGPGLHKRGYRKLVTEAPLKETLAAALIQLSRWNVSRPFYDPCCGSGTMLIEAAMIGWNIAPGLRRTFNSEDWAVIPEELWEQAREEAFDAVRDDVPLQISGSDIDPEAIEVAMAAIKSAGFAKDIEVSVLPAHRARPQGEYGVIITNPPYGERLSEEKEVQKLLRSLGRSYLDMPTWSFLQSRRPKLSKSISVIRQTNVASCSTDELKPSTISIWAHCPHEIKHHNLHNCNESKVLLPSMAGALFCALFWS